MWVVFSVWLHRFLRIWGLFGFFLVFCKSSANAQQISGRSARWEYHTFFCLFTLCYLLSALLFALLPTPPLVNVVTLIGKKKKPSKRRQEKQASGAQAASFLLFSHTQKHIDTCTPARSTAVRGSDARSSTFAVQHYLWGLPSFCSFAKSRHNPFPHIPPPPPIFCFLPHRHLSSSSLRPPWNRPVSGLSGGTCASLSRSPFVAFLPAVRSRTVSLISHLSHSRRSTFDD